MRSVYPKTIKDNKMIFSSSKMSNSKYKHDKNG